jgi:hypothetical protein
MNSELERCPKCHREGVSPWALLYAAWPFHTRCRNCGARLRAKIPHWQNILSQILAQAAFWALLLFGAVRGGLQGILAGGAVGIVVSVFIVLIPVFFSKLEALPE